MNEIIKSLDLILEEIQILLKPIIIKRELDLTLNISHVNINYETKSRQLDLHKLSTHSRLIISYPVLFDDNELIHIEIRDNYIQAIVKNYEELNRECINEICKLVKEYPLDIDLTNESSFLDTYLEDN